MTIFQSSKGKHTACLLTAVFLIFTCRTNDLRAEEIIVPALANEVQIHEAAAVLEEWLKAYRDGDYVAQWRLTHPRIRHWRTRSLWQKTMRRNKRKIGAIEDYNLLAAQAVLPRNIPCTEMGHCYRKDMQTVVIAVRITYARLQLDYDEFAIMANSEEGWRYGGGILLNRPFGETMVILDRADELRYIPDTSVIRP